MKLREYETMDWPVIRAMGIDDEGFLVSNSIFHRLYTPNII